MAEYRDYGDGVKTITRDGIEWQIIADDDICDCDCHIGMAHGFIASPDRCVDCLRASGQIKAIDWLGNTSR